MLAPTAQLLYACAHAMLQHGGRYTSLHWLYDLDRLIRVYAGRLDWDLFLAQAHAFEWSSAALAAFSESISLFETPIPPAVLHRLAQTSDRNAERVAALQSAPATHTIEEYQKLKALSWTGKVRLILALVIPAPAYMRWRYGLKTYWTLPAWYLYRWWGILKDALKSTLLVAHKVIIQTRPRNGSTLERSTQKSQP